MSMQEMVGAPLLDGVAEEGRKKEIESNRSTDEAEPVTITVSVPFLFNVAAISGGLGCILTLIIAVHLKQLPLWPLKNISQYAAKYPGIWLFRFCCALCGFCTVAVGYFGYLKQTDRSKFGWAAIFCGLGITGAGIVSCTEFNTLHLTFAVIFFVAGGVLSSLEAAYKRSCLMALSSLVIWISLIGIVVLAAEGKTGSALLSIFEWTVAALLLGLMLFMGR